MVYVVIKDLSSIAEDTIMITSSISTIARQDDQYQGGELTLGQ
jgi:uncharacterized membrane protein